IEARIRSELARGNFGILEPKPAPALAEFLKRDFLPYVEVQFKDKPNSAEYYRYGAASLIQSDLATLPLDTITDQHASQHIARQLAKGFKPTTINRDLRTLRRALSLARDWGKIGGLPKVTLAKGERQRDRVLSPEEARHYLIACPQPWRDGATLILGSGMRPEEVCELRWEQVELNGANGKARIIDAKTAAGKRPIPLLPEVYRALDGPDAYAMLKARREAQGFPLEGWVFPTGSASGHMEEDSYKEWHAKALTASKVTPFEPYCLRHTFLTWIAPHVDTWTLARIAGHASIRTTQRYIHPQERTVEQALARIGTVPKVPTNGTYQGKLLESGGLKPVAVKADESAA
ncbi:MAG: tyrosine-type recombinase/integrase, partial [Terriglobia bacterium]